MVSKGRETLVLKLFMSFLFFTVSGFVLFSQTVCAATSPKTALSAEKNSMPRPAYIPKGFPEEYHRLHGFYMGVGVAGAIAQSKVDTSSENLVYNQISGNILGFTYSTTRHHCDTIFNLAPSVQLGYWGDPRGYYQTQFSLSFLYQYLDTLDHFKGPIYSNSGQHEVDIYIKHQLSFLLQGGKSVDNFFFHMGLGPVILLTKDVGSVSFVGSPTISFNENRILWGGMAVAGVSFFFGERWTIDTSLSYTVSETDKLSKRVVYSGILNKPTVIRFNGTATVGYNSCIGIAELMITLNRFF
jgi:hypothetical protein